ncbi:hypothetical protein HF577_28825, partial [Pseudonocardia xinjiangensis]
MSSSSTSNAAGQFGPNEWLVEEMYQRFLDDPDSVDPAWHEFFADYRPTDENGASSSNGTPTPTADRSAAAAAAPAPTPTAEPAEPSERRRVGDRKAMT